MLRGLSVVCCRVGEVPLTGRRRSARRTGLWLGVAVAAQVFVSEEVLATSALVGMAVYVLMAVVLLFSRTGLFAAHRG